MADKTGSSSSSSSSSRRSQSPLLSNGRHNFDPHYFVLPNPFWIILIPSSLWLLALSTFSPDSIPLFLGPVGALARFIGHNYPGVCVFLCFGAAILHVGEAVYAGKVCHDRGMANDATVKWVLSTFVFGFSSLALRLLPYRRNSKDA